MRRFLVVQTAFLGDAVLATGLLEKLHAFFPGAAIDIAVRKGNEGLFAGHPFVHDVFVWDKGPGKLRALLRLIAELRRRRYDTVINAQRFLSTGLMTVLSRGRETIGYNKNPLSFLFSRRVPHVIPDWKELRGRSGTGTVVVHEMDRLNALIAHLTDGTRPLPRLYPDAAARAQAHAHGEGPYACIAPASVWFTKQWPEDKWAELVRTLPQGLRVLLIGAPGDVQLCERIARAAGRGEVLAGKLSLLATAALMEGAMMNYVNDSAPLHIASAMGAPVTAVFCSTVPAFGFGPLHPNGRVVEVSATLDCRPCGLHGQKACPAGHFRCALDIEVRRVIGTSSS